MKMCGGNVKGESTNLNVYLFTSLEKKCNVECFLL